MEIVAPAGDYNRFLACIKGGADSIYLGLKGVGARRKAPNFTLEELKEAIDFAHLKGVKVYLTLNTIFKDVEIEALYTNIKQIYEWGVDAFIVQDIGMLKFLKDNFPKVELHGSTQMTVSNHVEAHFSFILFISSKDNSLDKTILVNPKSL
jgi:putative protease